MQEQYRSVRPETSGFGTASRARPSLGRRRRTAPEIPGVHLAQRSRHRASVRCGRNGRESGATPAAARRAATDACRSIACLAPSRAPSHNTRGAPRGGNVPKPAKTSSKAGSWNVLTHEVDDVGGRALVHFADEDERQVETIRAHEAQRLRRVRQSSARIRCCAAATAARASSSSSMAVNSRMAFSSQRTWFSESLRAACEHDQHSSEGHPRLTLWWTVEL